LDSEIAFYQSQDGRINIEVLYDVENIWLTQKKIAELFNTTPQNIIQHTKNIYKDGEIDKLATCNPLTLINICSHYFVIPTEVGIQIWLQCWIPAFAGMTGMRGYGNLQGFFTSSKRR